MVVIHGTKKLLDRIPTPASDFDEPTGPLGSWYATVLFWKPHVALLVDEATYLPSRAGSHAPRTVPGSA